MTVPLNEYTVPSYFLLILDVLRNVHKPEDIKFMLNWYLLYFWGACGWSGENGTISKERLVNIPYVRV